jgi:hypothetical protein
MFRLQDRTALIPLVRVSGSEKNSASDYHVNGEELSQNWMVVLSYGGYNI